MNIKKEIALFIRGNMSYNAKLVIRDKYQEDILDLVEFSNAIAVDDIKNDIQIVDGNRLQGGTLGTGSIEIGRKFSFGIPIFEYKESGGGWVKIEEQYTKYTRAIMSNTSKQFYIRILYKNEIYEAEYALVKVSGYNITYINNLGVISIQLSAIDKVFMRQQTDKYDLILNGNATDRQNIVYYSQSLVPVPLLFTLEFYIEIGYLSFVFANRQNFGISFMGNVDKGKAIVYFNSNVLSINGIIYDYDGIAPELNVGQNILYLQYSEIIKKAIVEYKRGVLI